MSDRNFKSYYTRMWQEPDGRIVFDVGSWSEFFVAEGFSIDDFRHVS
jgi:hypothetical protein